MRHFLPRSHGPAGALARRRSVSGSRRLAAVAVVLALTGTVACSEVTALKQENPGAVSASSLYQPANAQLLVNSVIADFDCAFTRFVVGSALFSDELSNAIGSTANYDFDARRLQTNATYGTAGCGNNQQPPIFTTLSVARATADTVLAYLKGWTDAQMPTGVNRTRLIGQSATYAGYSLVLMGEVMCSAAINLGPELTPEQVFAEAKLRFDEAITAATTAGDAATLNLARLGRARTLLNQKQPAAAAQDAALIPAGFVHNVTGEGTNNRRQNFSFISINTSSWSTVDPTFRGLTINGVPDPRVAVTNTGRAGTMSGSQVWTPDKYPTILTSMPVARYAEAQLIVAEARVAANDLAGAATAINLARGTRVAVIGTYDATGKTQAQVLADIIEERRRELFLEGHRMGDMRRLNIAFTPAAGQPYPGGGGVYGPQTCFPLPDIERINNPNLGG